MPKPTPAETAILNVLWDRGPSTVRQVLDTLDSHRPTGYTTVLKLMQIMAEKGLIERQPGEARAHTFAAAVERDATQRQMVRELVERIFGGSSTQMVLQALEECPATAGELDEIRQLIDRRKHQREKGAARMRILLVQSLLHFLWQGAALAALLWVALRFLERPTARYNACAAALALMALAPVVTASGSLNPVS